MPAASALVPLGWWAVRAPPLVEPRGPLGLGVCVACGFRRGSVGFVGGRRRAAGLSDPPCRNLAVPLGWVSGVLLAFRALPPLRRSAGFWLPPLLELCCSSWRGGRVACCACVWLPSGCCSPTTRCWLRATLGCCLCGRRGLLGYVGLVVCRPTASTLASCWKNEVFPLNLDNEL